MNEGNKESTRIITDGQTDTPHSLEVYVPTFAIGIGCNIEAFGNSLDSIGRIIILQMTP